MVEYDLHGSTDPHTDLPAESRFRQPKCPFCNNPTDPAEFRRTACVSCQRPVSASLTCNVFPC
jgi:hypothetical protein